MSSPASPHGDETAIQASALAHVHEAVLATDAELRVVFCNPAAERLLGISASQVIERSISGLLPYTLLTPGGEDAIGRAVEQTGAWRGEMRITTGHGETRDVESSVTALQGTDGVLSGLVVVTHDITERRQAERRQRFLAEASTCLVSSLDVQDSLASLARLMVAELADWCVAAVLDERGQTGWTAAAHRDPALASTAPAWTAAIGERFLAEPAVVGALRSGAPLLIDDRVAIRHLLIAPEAALPAIGGPVLPTSCIVAPLIGRGRTLGAMLLGTWQPSPRFGRADLALAEELARYAALAVDNALLFQAAQETNQRLRVIGAITDATLAHAGDVNAVLQILVDQLAARMHFEAVNVRLLDDSGRWLDLRAAHNIPERYHGPLDVQASGNPLSRVIAAGKPVHIRDILAKPGIRHASYPFMQTEGYRSGLVVPLHASGRVIGVLSVYSRAVRTCSEAEERVLTAAADRVAAMVEQARLLERERQAHTDAQRSAARVARLQALTAALAGALTFERVTEVVVERGVAALEARAGALYLRTDEGEELVVVASAGYPSELVQPWRSIRLDVPSPATDAVNDMQPVWLEPHEAWAARYPRGRAIHARMGGEAAAAVPLMVGGRAIGALTWTFDGPRTFCDEERAFAAAISDQCAQAIERTRLQRAAARAAAALEADHLKTQLLNTTSHELRTPLAAIKGFTSMLLAFGDKVDPGEQTATLAEIDDAADRLAGLVDNLLRLSNLESGTLDLEFAAVPLSALVDGTVQEARSRYPERVIELESEADLPAIAADAHQLGQAVGNLIDNAVKFSPRGGAVRVAATASESEVSIAVTDTGIGIAPEHHERIFDRFYRVDSAAAQDIGGTGLGLAVSRRIVEAHGGTISVRSREGAGSTFTITIPTADPADSRS